MYHRFGNKRSGLQFGGVAYKLARLQKQGCRPLMRKWQCIVCGWIYDEAEGCEEEGIAPGTPWEDVPEDFVCPECGVSKEDFEMIEVG
jgi:rubredoxin